MNTNGFLCVCEGPDGAGKTTISHKVVEFFKQRNHDVVRMDALKEGPVTREFYKTLKTGTVKKITEILSMAAGITETFYNAVEPALEDGKTIVMDRWFPSYYAYQCVGRKSALAQAILSELMNLDLVDLYIYCQVNQEVANQRIAVRGDSSYLDLEKQEFKACVNAGYERWFNGHEVILPKVITLDCNQPLEMVYSELENKLNDYFTTNVIPFSNCQEQ